ncbi:MAG: hypothetical protein HRU20_14990 [Pseudomonadales bacterium]|nr:hypothetical protein [Pseudomonadales bacterium]
MLGWWVMGLMAGLCLWLFYPTVLWFISKLFSSAFAGLLVIMLGLSCYLRPPARVQWQLLHFGWLAFLLFGFSVLGYLANENYLGIQLFSAALFIAAAYSLSGMVLCAAAWRGLFLPCCLLIVI